MIFGALISSGHEKGSRVFTNEYFPCIIALIRHEMAIFLCEIINRRINPNGRFRSHKSPRKRRYNGTR